MTVELEHLPIELNRLFRIRHGRTEVPGRLTRGSPGHPLQHRRRVDGRVNHRDKPGGDGLSGHDVQNLRFGLIQLDRLML